MRGNVLFLKFYVSCNKFKRSYQDHSPILNHLFSCVFIQFFFFCHLSNVECCLTWLLVAERVVSSPHTWRWLWVSFFFYQFSLIDGLVGLLGTDCLCSIVTPPYSASIQNPQGFDAILDSRIPVCATVYFLIKVVNMKSNKKISGDFPALWENDKSVLITIHSLWSQENCTCRNKILTVLHSSYSEWESLSPFWALIANVVCVSFFFVVTF